MPAPRRRHLTSHQVKTAFQIGWAELENGRLLAAAEKEFEALVTTDKNLRYQQNLAGRRLAILVLPTTSWHVIQTHLATVVPAVDQLAPGDFIELAF